MFAEILVSVFICFIYCAIKHTYFVSVYDLYTSFFKMCGNLVFIIKFPVFVVKIAKAFAYTSTFWIFLLFRLRTCAAFIAILIWFEYCSWKLRPSDVVNLSWIVLTVTCWTIQHQPRCWKSRVRSCNYYYVIVFVFIYFFHCLFVEISLKKLICHYYFFFFIFKKWKPLFVKHRMQHLLATIGYDYSFWSELDACFLFWKDNVAILIIFLYYALLSNWCRKYISII